MMLLKIFTNHFSNFRYNKYMFLDIVQEYKKYNDEEIDNLSQIKSKNEIPTLKDIAQVVHAETYIKEGMILVRKHPRFCYVKKHSHNYLEVNYVLSGKVTQILDKNTITLKQGEILFISKNSEHEFEPAEEDDILLNFIILPEFFDFFYPFIEQNSNIKKFLVNLLSNKEESNSIIFRVSQYETIQNIVKNILITFNEKYEKTNDLLRQYFLLLIYELLKHTDSAEETKKANYDSIILFKTYNYLENNYINGSLKGLSLSLKEDYYYLSKRIKILTGFTFQQLLQAERIKAAKSLLESTDANINDIAYHVGYNNLTFFYKMFKKEVGQSPLEYRNSHIKAAQ